MDKNIATGGISGQGFAEGYKTAVGRCMENGGGDSGV